MRFSGNSDVVTHTLLNPMIAGANSVKFFGQVVLEVESVIFERKPICK